MRLILLVRHGESADKQPAQSDFNRVLTSRGHDSMERFGSFLRQENLIPKIIASSSAIRTVETVESILKAFEVPHPVVSYEQGLYQGSEYDYFDFVCGINASTEACMIVGHNPSISSLIGLLTGQYSIALHPGQGALIEMDKVSTTPAGQLMKLIGPFLK